MLGTSDQVDVWRDRAYDEGSRGEGRSLPHRGLRQCTTEEGVGERVHELEARVQDDQCGWARQPGGTGGVQEECLGAQEQAVGARRESR